MTCTQSNKTNVTVNDVIPTPIYGKGVGTTRLFVSDNPESIQLSNFTNGFATLWDDTVTGKSSVSYRVFFWHLNKTGQDIKIGLTLGNGSSGSTADSYKVESLKTAVAVVSNFQAHGVCAAKALLGSTLDTATSVDSTIASNKVGLIKDWTVPNNYLVGGIIEFNLTNSTSTRGMIYKLRTVAANSTTADLRYNQNAVASANGSHPRGSWSFANVEGYADQNLTQPVTYSLGSGDKNFSISNTVNDNILSAATSYNSSNALSNPGHYGSIYTVRLNLINSSSSSKTSQIYLNARGGYYGGAVKYNGTTYGIANLPPSTGAVHVADVTVGANQSTTITIQSCHAGGYSLPLGILFRTL
ncbi:MAG: hypothetical protein ACOY35_11400 [Bacillota bacterium]